MCLSPVTTLVFLNHCHVCPDCFTLQSMEKLKKNLQLIVVASIVINVPATWCTLTGDNSFVAVTLRATGHVNRLVLVEHRGHRHLSSEQDRLNSTLSAMFTPSTTDELSCPSFQPGFQLCGCLLLDVNLSLHPRLGVARFRLQSSAASPQQRSRVELITLQPSQDSQRLSRLSMPTAPFQRTVQDQRVRSRRCLECRSVSEPESLATSCCERSSGALNAEWNSSRCEWPGLDRSVCPLNVFDRHLEPYCCMRSTATCRIRGALDR